MRGSCLSVLLLLSCGSGCSNFHNYLRDRGLDFVDIFTFKAGSGFGVSTGVNLFGVFGAYTGISKTCRAGIEGRRFLKDEHSVLGPPLYTVIVPTVSVIRGDYNRYSNPTLGVISVALSIVYPGDEKIHRNPERIKPFIESIAEFSTADFELFLYKIGALLGLNEPVEDPLSGGLRDLDFRVSFCFFIEFEFGFNPVELLDFILGLFNIDIMGDDTKREQEQQTPPKESPKDELMRPLE